MENFTLPTAAPLAAPAGRPLPPVGQRLASFYQASRRAVARLVAGEARRAGAWGRAATTAVAAKLPPASAFAAFFLHQARTSAHVQFVYDVASGRVVFVNAAYARVLHGTRTRVNAELPALLARLHPDDRAFLARYWRLWGRGQMPDEVELRLQHPGRPDQWLLLTPAYQKTAGGHVLLGGTLLDISAPKHAQATADQRTARQHVTLELLAHDLSGAFVMVEQIAHFLRDEATPPPSSRVAAMLRVLETTSQQSVKMLRDFVQVEALAAGQTPPPAGRVDVAAALRPALAQLHQTQALLGRAFTYALPDQPAYANLDVLLFTQVLTNLVGNALKFTPAGGHVTVRVAAAPGCVRLQVQDDGIGIPLALQAHLFERFTLARRPGLRGEEPTGLGLALCHTIVAWHHGTLTVASAEGQGSTFTVEIPRAL